jgi:hypothetical protein
VVEGEQVVKSLVNKSKLDVVKVFLCYVATVGDVEKTALACDLDPQTVSDLATSEGWAEKVRRLSLASKHSGLQAGDFERMQNRALAWVQGHRLRQVLDTVLCALSEKSQDELMETITEEDKLGNRRINARVFSDLSKSLETCNGLCFAALGDTIPERQALAPDAAASTAAVHASLIAALNAPGVKRVSSEQLVIDAAKAIEALSSPEPVRQLGTGEETQVPCQVSENL